jgi:hypothetical protein
MQLQTHRTHFHFRHHARQKQNIKYAKITQALKTILKEEGIRVKKKKKKKKKKKEERQSGGVGGFMLFYYI